MTKQLNERNMGMSKPLKQIEQFDDIDEINAWLSARINDKYETDIRITPDYLYVIYWEQTND